MALHRSSKFNAADGLFETEKTVTPIKEKEQKSAEKRQKTEKKAEETEIAKSIEKSAELTEEATASPVEIPLKTRELAPDYMVSISASKKSGLIDESPNLAPAPTPVADVFKEAKEQAKAEAEKDEPLKRAKKKLSATAIMPRKVPKKASESVINRTYTIDQGTYDLMSALVRFMRDSKVKDEETGYLINESAFIRRAIRTEMDRVFDSNDEDFSDSVRQYLDKPLKSSPSKITY